MKLDAPKNPNYSATVVKLNTIVDLAGLDNLVGVPAFGFQALTTRGPNPGDLMILLGAETQLSEEYAAFNNLYRSEELNSDKTEKGYLEKSARIRAIKMRGHTSNALLMPLSSVEFTGIPWWTLEEGDTFDAINGHEICRKYEIPVKSSGSHPQRTKLEKAFKRVDHRVFPEHLSTDNYFRNKHLLKPGQEVICTQKLHGTSLRVGRVPVLRQLKWYEKLLQKLGVKIPSHEFDVVFGSRKVIKDANNPNQQHFYANDVWTQYGKTIADVIPEGYILYGELIGYVPNTETPVQKNYTYDCPPGHADLYVYRVAHVNANGILADLSWDGVKDFCRHRGLKWVPELCRGIPAHPDFEDSISQLLDARLAVKSMPAWNFTDEAVALSNEKTVDEGVCIRQDQGIIPLLLKAKSPLFLEHESKMLDSGEADLESTGMVA